MSGRSLNIIISGDSAGATLAVNVIFKILETHQTSPKLPLPISMVLNYAALDFNFTSWMTPDNLRVLRSEQSTGSLPALEELTVQKDHFQHMVR
jgi:acetyl esterase/lipase